MKKQQLKEEMSISKALSDLKEISDWFDSHEELDIDLAIEKIKTGVALVKICKERLKAVENTFVEIKKELTTL